jgi:predicted small integral membrane protein
MGLSWMAWTWPTAAFFVFIALCLVAVTVWDLAVPGGGARRGVLGLDTTRGDRLFISLLGSAFIFLAWLAVYSTPLWAPLAIALLFALLVFLYV